MELFQTLEKTSSGRPVLLEGEIECYSHEEISLYEGEEKTTYKRGRCVVTTHRLFWIQETQNIAIFLLLSYAKGLSKEPGFLKRSSKLRIDLCNARGKPMFVKLSFKHGGRDDMYPRLAQALQRKTWNNTLPSATTDKRLEKREFSTGNAGIAGILKRQQDGQKQTTQLAEQAFTDLNTLMTKAKDVVGVMERYIATQSKTEIKENDLDSLLLTMGIASPVTKESAGAAYHQELARQLAQFILPTLETNQGIMSLSDIYCLFNRARGTELISPDDLHYAATLLCKLRLSMHLRKFEGGLLVIQLDSLSESTIGISLKEAVEKSSQGYLTATEVATTRNISITLAMEYLKIAEKQGYLCRDDSFEGLSFYSNLFSSIEC